MIDLGVTPLHPENAYSGYSHVESGSRLGATPCRPRVSSGTSPGRRRHFWSEKSHGRRGPKVVPPESISSFRHYALWNSINQRPLGYQGIGALIRGLGKRAGLQTHINPHSLRRACVTHMLRRGADPVSIQQLLGHASLATLGQYLRVSITDIKAMHENTRPGRR